MHKDNINLTKQWDVIIVGTGMGGATLGYSLAQKGFSVLFLEKGGDVAAGLDMPETASPDERLTHGWWPQPLTQATGNQSFNQFFAAIGCGMGGSTIHYAAALERFEPTDFEALHTEHQSLSTWPISYEELLPYYKRAEELYGINTNNTENDIKTRLSEWDQSLMQVLRDNGLKPEKLNVGIKYDNDCIECIGKVCHRRCKADAKVTCLDKALLKSNCQILTNCEVSHLGADKNSIKQITADYQGKNLNLKSKLVVIAAGAMHTPLLLLRSKNTDWPNGIANSSDQIGRNLMFHATDLYAIWSPKKLNRKGIQKKALSIRDFYNKNGQRMGYIQSLGLDAGRGDISFYLKNLLRKYGVRNEFLLSAMTKIPATIASYILGEASIFAASIEDDPLPLNRVTLNPTQPNGASFNYTITAEMRRRANDLYNEFSQSIKPWRIIKITPSIEINSGHSCGTCRFGDDPKTSVLDRNCRSHDIHNLYVVDSSFMPRSGAANPSLTIAANALRVAEKIADALN